MNRKEERDELVKLEKKEEMSLEESIDFEKENPDLKINDIDFLEENINDERYAENEYGNKCIFKITKEGIED